MENIMRIVFMVMLLSTAVISQSCTSPTTRCDCFQLDGKTIINCRYKNLTAIPTFTNTNQVYDEIRFTSFEETGTCQPFAGCNNIRQIGAKAFANLKVKKIDLLNNPVTLIDNYAFEGLAPEIESISLEGDGSNGMPDQALAALDEQLKTLHLEKYGDTSIDAPIVFPFPYLESLTIKKWKNLKSINADIFGVMKDLKELKLIALRNITILPVPAIQKFLKLTSLDIMDIGITSIDGDSFTPMSLLKDIKIRNNIHLNTIDQRTFSGVTDSVEFLEIDNNNLNNKLSLEFLRNENWPALSHLNIGYNFNLRDLPSEIFSKTPALAYLQCQDIGLTSINKDMFSGLVSLHTLDLAYNNIRTVTAQTFKNSPSLVELRLHDQQSIDYLDIQNNAFTGIETSLETLSLQNNKLNISQFWMDLSTLTNLLVLEETQKPSCPSGKAILFNLLRSNKPKKEKPLTEPVRISMKADVPHASGTAEHLSEKVEKGASTADTSVTVISNGNINNQSRISAGSYQTLNEKGVDSRPMPSSYGHYTNDIGERPLPNAPRGATGHEYVNSGFMNSADHLPETSKNDYSEV
ncbi:leucine-rich repeat-containing G-protein coupled receptor 5A-like [Ruditapes philippinarum]|uniref:leucine-rich repeat-containing G-protein coupled receptor 5A-like n=1 Tax=Ruditapes philippinarum TaxID=129788 RepID=UPI00295B3A4E|nr:leucine-rich repeat-containing G-protein coupled receptor 5A-like [Ruditapes philippinarum]